MAQIYFEFACYKAVKLQNKEAFMCDIDALKLNTEDKFIIIASL